MRPLLHRRAASTIKEDGKKVMKNRKLASKLIFIYPKSMRYKQGDKISDNTICFLLHIIVTFIKVFFNLSNSSNFCRRGLDRHFHVHLRVHS